MAKAYVNKRDKFLWDNSFKPEDKIPTPSASDEGKAIVVDDDGNYALDEVSAETIYFDLRLDTSDSTLTVTDTEYTVAEINDLARTYANVSLRVQYDEDDIYRLFRLYRVEDTVTKWNDTVSSAEDGVININTDSINMQNNGTVRFYRRTLSNTPYNYSTTERIVGIWIDGKPVYEKVITLDNVNITNGTIGFATDLSNIDNIATIYGTIKEAGGQSIYTLPWAGLASTGVYFNTSDNKIYFKSSDTFSNATIYLNVQYTKTTD